MSTTKAEAPEQFYLTPTDKWGLIPSPDASEGAVKYIRADLAPAGEKCLKCGDSKPLAKVDGCTNIVNWKGLSEMQPVYCGCKCVFAPAGELVSREAAEAAIMSLHVAFATSNIEYSDRNAYNSGIDAAIDVIRALPSVARVPVAAREISRERLMQVLDKNFKAAGIQITVRRYNQIVTDLGFALDDYGSVTPTVEEKNAES
jgi:hypothetical protein